MVKTKFVVVSGQIRFENKKNIQQLVVSIIIICIISLFILRIDYVKTLLPDSNFISNSTVQKSSYNWISSISTSSSSSNSNYNSNYNSSNTGRIESNNTRNDFLTELERIDSIIDSVDNTRTVLEPDTGDKINKLQLSNNESGQLEEDNTKNTNNVTIVSNDTNNVNNTISTTDDVPVEYDKQSKSNETVKLEINDTNNVKLTLPKTDAATQKTTALLMNEESINNTTKTVSLFTLNDEWKKVTAISLTSFGTNIQHTIEYNQKDSAHMGPFTDSGFNGKYCSTILQKIDNNNTTTQQQTSYTWDTIPTTMINITFSCGQLFYESKAVGTGNFLSLFYSIRLIAIQWGNIDITIQCSDANITKDRLILPWLTGTFPRTDWTVLNIGNNNNDTSTTTTNNKQRSASDRSNPTMVEACYPYAKSSIGYIIESSVYELRRMAIALVGIPSKSHPAYEWAEQYLWSTEAQSSIQNQQLTLPAPKKGDKPLLNMSNFEIDDVAIHFRCGDIIDSKHPSFGFMKFESFSRYINSETTKSIGIVTSPLEPSTEVRTSDKGHEKIYRCKKVINLFVQHLYEKFTNNITITIRNDPTETIAATYARIIMAKQTMIGISSFGVFAGLATFGIGYIRKPDYVKAPNRFLINHPNISQLVPNVQLISEPRLMAADVKSSWPKDDGASVIRWFQNYNVTTLN